MPGTCSSVASSDAVTWLELTKVVGRGALLNCTMLPDVEPLAAMKFVPATVTCMVDAPAAAEFGVSAVMVGVETGAGPVTENTRAFETDLSGFWTVMSAVAGATISDAGMIAVNCTLATKPVTRV